MKHTREKSSSSKRSIAYISLKKYIEMIMNRDFGTKEEKNHPFSYKKKIHLV
mgnify:CR=1 FL=1